MPRCLHRTPLSLARDPAASVIGAADGSAEHCHVDPRAELQTATERNAREAREEREKADTAKAAQAEADTATKAQADTTAKERADAAAKAQEAEAAHGRAPLLAVPLRAVPPAPEIEVPTGRAGDDQPVMERGGGDPVIVEAEVPPPMPTAGAQPVGLRRRKCRQSVASWWWARLPRSALRGAATDLQQRLGEAQTELCTKEEERRKAVEECDHLAKELAAQADQHKAALKKEKDDEAALQAEFETECSA
nr:uncharacterized protein LOC109761331 [Aegilops tauschii subsp. strangulata]